MENGIRALWFGSNPHSNGDDFSRFEILRMAVNHEIINTIPGRIIATREDVKSKFIN